MQSLIEVEYLVQNGYDKNTAANLEKVWGELANDKLNVTLIRDIIYVDGSRTAIERLSKGFVTAEIFPCKADDAWYMELDPVKEINRRKRKENVISVLKLHGLKCADKLTPEHEQMVDLIVDAWQIEPKFARTLELAFIDICKLYEESD